MQSWFSNQPQEQLQFSLQSSYLYHISKTKIMMLLVSVVKATKQT